MSLDKIDQEDIEKINLRIAKLEERYVALKHNTDIKLAKIKNNYEKHRLETARLVKSNNNRNWSYMNKNLKRIKKDMNKDNTDFWGDKSDKKKNSLIIKRK